MYRLGSAVPWHIAEAKFRGMLVDIDIGMLLTLGFLCEACCPSVGIDVRPLCERTSSSGVPATGSGPFIPAATGAEEKESAWEVSPFCGGFAFMGIGIGISSDTRLGSSSWG